MGVSRRGFLGIALAGSAAVPLLWQQRAWARPAPARRKVLVCIFQRGAVDGLSMVVPHAEPAYYRVRKSIAIARPGKGDGACVDLDGRFALHPRLAALKPLFAARELAIVHAVGSPDPTRSHFDAQDFMESGTPGIATTAEGWLNRALSHGADRAHTPFRGVAMEDELPLSLRGAARTLAVGDLASFGMVGKGAVRRKLGEGFAALYAGPAGNDPVRQAGVEALGALGTLRARHPERFAPAPGVRYPKGRLSKKLRQIAQLIKADVGVDVAFADGGGWDTHVLQGGAEGRLARRLAELGGALAAFRRDLGDRMQDVVVLTMSEFGRTVAENGSGGTDHGHGNAYFVLGGPVHGGKVYGRWPGLEPAQLYQRRDLAVTTDFRDIFSEIVTRHLGVHRAAEVFPGYKPRRLPGLLA